MKGDDFFGGFLNIAFGYGLALMLGILVSGGVRYNERIEKKKAEFLSILAQFQTFTFKEHPFSA